MNKNLINTYCSVKYYKQFDSDELLKQVQNKVDSSISNISKEMLFVFNKILTTDPCSYWDISVYKQTSSLLENLFQTYGSILEIDETTFNYYLMGYNSYIQLSEIILDLRNFNIAQETKIRLYHLPTYTAILESCLSNFMRVIATLTGKGIGKDYTSQHTLGSLVQILNSNGYSEITNNINVNLRNAINHGRIQIKREAMGDKLCFNYVESNLPKTLEMSVYEFESIIDKSFDTASGVLLSISKFINEHLPLLAIDISKREYVQFALCAMELSLPGLCCQSISDTGNTKQLNIEMEIQNTDRAYIGEIATLLAILVYEKYSEYEQYMFSFSNPRMINGWVRYKNQEIKEMSTETKTFGDVLKCVIERQDCIIFNQSQEEIDLNEVKYFCFPNIIMDTYKINNIEDASIEDRKRLKARLYVGFEDDRQKLLNIFNEAIEKLKSVKNPPSPAMYHKNGSMDADSLYINVYRIDTRKSKELYPNNDNFVCMLDYNSNGITTLKNGGILESIWRQLHHETMENLQIAWREGKFATRRNVEKIGRNDPCPCGSGNKYKKCCGC